MPLASIDNPEANVLIATMKSSMKNGRRRFSDSSISYYFRIMRQVIASQMEKFRPVHFREWNLAAISLPRVNPRNQRRPTLTPKEMTTLLRKAVGQYLMVYFLREPEKWFSIPDC